MVYCIAKELQMLKPHGFGNIFLGIGGFHMEKIVIACLGKYLEEAGIASVFEETKTFGKVVAVNSVMNGGHYIRGKRGMGLIAETMTSLQLQAFFDTDSNNVKFQDLLHQIVHIQTLLDSDVLNYEMIRADWVKCKSHMGLFQDAYSKFKDDKGKESENFRYWTIFLDDLYPILRDLTQSHREGNWELHLSAVQRSLSLFFAFDRTNYRRWIPLYFEDCLNLNNDFPEIYESFLKGGFIVKQTSRNGSGLPMDQALEKSYNKPAKSSGGIIGFSRKKQAVALWNIIKHEKGQFKVFLRELSGLIYEDETSLHQDISESPRRIDMECIAELTSYIFQRGSPFII